MLVFTTNLIFTNFFNRCLFYVPRLSDATTENVKLMSQQMCLEGKFDIRVSSTFGTPAGILLHAEKNAGHRSLSRRRKN